MANDQTVAFQVREILASATYDELLIQEAADLARVDTPDILRKITPRFEAYFAVAALLRAILLREDRDMIERRRVHAIELVDVWATNLQPDATHA